MTSDDSSYQVILRNAIEMEIEGKGFYERATAALKHQRAKDTFLGLAKQEQRHIEVLSAELARLEQGKGWASLQDLREQTSLYPKISVFQDRDLKHLALRPDAGELEVLQVGIDVEKRSVDYYRSAGSSAGEDKAREVFNWLVGEEAGHLTILTAEYEYRTKSGFYYDNMEFSLEVM